MTPQIAAEKTAADLAKMGGAELVATYNALVTKDREVKRFATPAKGRERIARAIADWKDAHPAPVAAVKKSSAAAKAALVGEKAPAKKMGAKKAGAKVSTTGKTSISERIRVLCEDGHDNASIWAIVQPEFGLPDRHKWYPAWYRRHHAQKGA